MSKPYLKKTDAWSTVFFADVIGSPLALLLARLKIHPNVITFFSIFPLFFTVYFWLQHTFWGFFWGAIFWQISWIFDCTDGKVARINSTFSDFGAKFDKYFDKVRKIIALGVMLYGIYFYTTPLIFYISLAGVIFHYLQHILVHYLFKVRAREAPYDKRLFKRVGEIYTAYDEQFLMFFLFPLIGYPHLGIIIATFLFFLRNVYLFLKEKV